MTRPTWLPLHPTDPPGLHKAQTSGAWLTHEMERRNISNLELYGRLRAAGFRGVSTNIISLWRTDKTAIAPETLPLLLEALDMPFPNRQLWAKHFFHAQHPDLAGLIFGLPPVAV